MSHYGEYIAHFHPEGMFDHCPCTIVDRKVEFNGKKSFKYFNMWGASEHFSASVDGVWKQSYRGTKMFNVVKKLKALKPVLKNLNKNCFSDIENSTNIAGTVLQQIQKKLVESPRDLDLIQQEYDLANELKDLTLARDSFLSQKAKIQWSISGDLNTSYFHQVMKKRVMLNKVMQIEDMNGNVCTTGDTIQKAFLDYYQNLLGSHTDTVAVEHYVVTRGPCCTAAHWNILDTPITVEEVKKSIFSIPKDKSPGPDGYTSQFYRDAWDIVGDEVCDAVRNFFDTGDVQSIMLLLRALSTFSASSGLRDNTSKSEVVFNGVAASLKLDIIQVSGFQEGSLPFKYLVFQRIRGIGARKLSYAGRLILINSVLNTLHNYWASIFLIPKGVISRIEMICRNFLWAGDAEYQRVPLVAWKKVCCSKKEGGLGVKDARVWNIATIDHVYMKGTDWNSYQPPPDSNWNWRNILDAGNTPPIPWYKDVWDGWATPKHSLIGWLIKHEALNTRAKLFSLGLCNTNRCVLCEKEEQGHVHLFGSCDYSSKVVVVLEDWLHINLSIVTVWMERNNCRVDLKLRRPDIVADEIKATVKARLIQVVTRPVLVGDKDFLVSLGLNM
ncbi:uncharacterized protein LOC141600910 [Silene latifolia]|uniref:uncharacterized protein LOC141600910 n=1 Tax=Silene latifolia TaxID=37657 RepID=UPI003D76CF84